MRFARFVVGLVVAALAVVGLVAGSVIVGLVGIEAD